MHHRIPAIVFPEGEVSTGLQAIEYGLGTRCALLRLDVVEHAIAVGDLVRGGHLGECPIVLELDGRPVVRGGD